MPAGDLILSGVEPSNDFACSLISCCIQMAQLIAVIGAGPDFGRNSGEDIAAHDFGDAW